MEVREAVKDINNHDLKTFELSFVIINVVPSVIEAQEKADQASRGAKNQGVSIHQDESTEAKGILAHDRPSQVHQEESPQENSVVDKNKRIRYTCSD